MKIQLKSPILWNGEHNEAGSVLDLNDTEAANLIGRGRAVPYTEPKPAVNRSVGLETSGETQNVVKRAYKRKSTAKK